MEVRNLHILALKDRYILAEWTKRTCQVDNKTGSSILLQHCAVTQFSSLLKILQATLQCLWLPVLLKPTSLPVPSASVILIFKVWVKRTFQLFCWSLCTGKNDYHRKARIVLTLYSSCHTKYYTVLKLSHVCFWSKHLLQKDMGISYSSMKSMDAIRSGTLALDRLCCFNAFLRRMKTNQY